MRQAMLPDADLQLRNSALLHAAKHCLVECSATGLRTGQYFSHIPHLEQRAISIPGRISPNSLTCMLMALDGQMFTQA